MPITFPVVGYQSQLRYHVDVEIQECIAELKQWRLMTIDEYLALPYHFELVPDEHEEGRRGWVVAVEELPGCVSQGDTPDEAMEDIRDAMAGWISVAMEDGQEIPQPRPSLPTVESSWSGSRLAYRR